MHKIFIKYLKAVRLSTLFVEKIKRLFLVFTIVIFLLFVLLETNYLHRQFKCCLSSDGAQHPGPGGAGAADGGGTDEEAFRRVPADTGSIRGVPYSS